MKRILSIVLTMMLCILCVTGQTKGQNAEQYFNAGAEYGGWNSEGKWIKDNPNHAKALPYYEKAATLGHGEAAYRAARHYDLGLGCTKDLAKAAYYYEMAIENKVDFKDHYQFAANDAGWKYMTEPSIRDYDKAFKYLQIGVDHRHNFSFNNLGYLYLFGLGCKKDAVRAYNLCCESLNRKNPYANNNLAYMYYYGEGVEQSYDQAWKCLQATKKELSHVGKFIHANCLFQAYCTEQNLDEARKLYQESANEGFEPAKQMLANFDTEKEKTLARIDAERRAEEARKAEQERIRKEEERLRAIEREKENARVLALKKNWIGKKIYWTERTKIEHLLGSGSTILDLLVGVKETSFVFRYVAVVEGYIGDNNVKCIVTNAEVMTPAYQNDVYKRYYKEMREECISAIGQTRVLEFDEFFLQE